MATYTFFTNLAKDARSFSGGAISYQIKFYKNPYFYLDLYNFPDFFPIFVTVASCKDVGII